MDCDEGEHGWFEFKGYVLGLEWEGNINQAATCSGTAGGSPPYTHTGNHMVRCGYFNVFEANDGSCIVDYL